VERRKAYLHAGSRPGVPVGGISDLDGGNRDGREGEGGEEGLGEHLRRVLLSERGCGKR
jgi:hypothetical protein